MILDALLVYVEEFVAGVGVAVITLGALRSVYQLVRYALRSSHTLTVIRWQFGEVIILGLEFMVGADIIGSLIEVDYYRLGLLAVLIVIRTALSYFLKIEMESIKLVAYNDYQTGKST